MDHEISRGNWWRGALGPVRSPAALLLLLAALCPRAFASEQAPVRLLNYEDGETVRHPVQILRGELDDSTLTTVTVTNASSISATRKMTGLAHRGRFIALTELVPGANRVTIGAGDHGLTFTLHYLPQTNPYIARVIYLLASDGGPTYQTQFENDPQDWRGKLGTAMKILQAFTAESMNDRGFGRRTFNLEFDRWGGVKAHALQGTLTTAEYHKMDPTAFFWNCWELVPTRMPNPRATSIVIPAFTRYDPRTGKLPSYHSAGVPNLSVYLGTGLYSWPSSLAEVQPTFLNDVLVNKEKVLSHSVGRDTFWANASSDLGEVLRVLGQSLGCLRSAQPGYIMTDGYHHLNRAFTLVEPPHVNRKEPLEFKQEEIPGWSPVSAGFLAYTRHFALEDRAWCDEDSTRVILDSRAGQFVVSSANGVRYVGVVVKGCMRHFYSPASSARPAPMAFRIAVADLGSKTGGEDFMIRVLDGEGLWRDVDVASLVVGPWVRAWRFSHITYPWVDQTAFVPLPDAEREKIAVSAEDTRLVTSEEPFVDFAPNFPASCRYNRAGYAMRIIRSRKARLIRIFTGSDDALRLWLNGKLVQQVLSLRVATADQESVVVELQKGRNTLLAEVSQGPGGWGLYLRIEDENGVPLKLAEDGTLHRAIDRDRDKMREILWPK